MLRVNFFIFFFALLLHLQSFKCQVLVPLTKNTISGDCPGIESFEKVMGIDVPSTDRIPLYSSSNGAITADCYNRCRSTVSCTAFWIDYNTNSCYRVANAKFNPQPSVVNTSHPYAYFERVCFTGDVCSKAWVTERSPGFELVGFDDVIIRSVTSRKRCSELCLTDKRLPCRSADYWESRKECRLSREDRKTQPAAFLQGSPEVEYIESNCAEPISSKGRHCDWEVMPGYAFVVGDFTSKADNLEDCQKQCGDYNAFTCKSVTFDGVSGICLLSGSDMSTTSPRLLRAEESKTYAQRTPCIDMTLECHGDTMVAKLKTHSPFYGKLYASVQTPECEVFGHGKLMTAITYPLGTCGTHKDSEGTYIGNLVVQQHPLIQKRGDAAFRLVCSFPEVNRTLSQTLGFEKGSESRLVESIGSGSAIPTQIYGVSTSVINATAKSPNVKLRIQDKNGNDVSGVTLGDELFIKIEVDSESAYGIFARDLVATSGTNEEELVLLDSRGCPEDPAIFPPLKKVNDKSKSLRGRFEAFKFNNDAVVRFQVYLQFCRHECNPIRCDGEVSFGRRKRSKTDGKQANDGEQFVELQKEIIVNGHLDRKKAGKLDNAQRSLADSDLLLCGPKNLLIATIIGFCLIQVVIVFCCAACICHSSKDKLLPDPNYLGSSPDIFYRRTPSSIFNSIRTLRTRRD